MTAPLVVVGDALLDVDLCGDVDRLAPDAPVPVIDHPTERFRPGGAALAAILSSRHHPGPIRFVTMLGGSSGRRVARLLEDAGVEVCDLGAGGSTPTKTRIVGGGQRVARVDRGGIRGGPTHPEHLRAACDDAAAVVASDYGGGLLADAPVRAMLTRRGGAPLVWDPHPRGTIPLRRTTLVSPNLAEARAFAPVPPTDDSDGLHAALWAGSWLVARWSVDAVAVTMGGDGVLLCDRSGTPLVCTTRALDRGADTCGAGDVFAVAVASALAAGGLLREAVDTATAAATAFVAEGGVSRTPGLPTPSAPAATRGGRVVATSGCFDLLHVGHVRFLESARRLGDHLVVLLNSDTSVTALKGPGRPLQHERDRADILASLGFVDEVIIFDEATPSRALAELRPQVFAKGGDYDRATLPEAAVVESWGGIVVTIPFHTGHSTTRLIEEARAHD